MQVFTTFEQGAIVFCLVGELDEHSAESTRRYLDKEMSTNNYTAVIFDLARLAFMDSTGIGVIIGRYKLARQNNKPMYVRRVSNTVDKIFTMSGLYEIITKL